MAVIVDNLQLPIGVSEEFYLFLKSVDFPTVRNPEQLCKVAVAFQVCASYPEVAIMNWMPAFAGSRE